MSAHYCIGLAIVGIGSRWPGGSDDTEQFWAMLVEGRSGTGKLGEKRGGAGMTGLPGGFLDEVDKFSPGFFGINQKQHNGLI